MLGKSKAQVLWCQKYFDFKVSLWRQPLSDVDAGVKKLKIFRSLPLSKLSLPTFTFNSCRTELLPNIYSITYVAASGHSGHSVILTFQTFQRRLQNNHLVVGRRGACQQGEEALKHNSSIISIHLQFKLFNSLVLTPFRPTGPLRHPNNHFNQRLN